MVKKLKKMAEDRQDNQLARAVKDSAQQIWLAGLGAFSKAREERTKVFEALVREGRSIQLRTKALAEERIGEVTGRVNEVREMVGKQATESWDKLEQVFEDRVSRALGRLGVPTSQDIKALVRRVDELTASVHALGGKVPAKRAAVGRTAKAAKAAPAKKARAARPAAKAAKAATAARAAKAAPAAKAAKAARTAAGTRARRAASKAADAAPATPAGESGSQA